MLLEAVEWESVGKHPMGHHLSPPAAAGRSASTLNTHLFMHVHIYTVKSLTL